MEALAVRGGQFIGEDGGLATLRVTADNPFVGKSRIEPTSRPDRVDHGTSFAVADDVRVEARRAEAGIVRRGDGPAFVQIAGNSGRVVIEAGQVEMVGPGRGTIVGQAHGAVRPGDDSRGVFRCDSRICGRGVNTAPDTTIVLPLGSVEV